MTFHEWVHEHPDVPAHELAALALEEIPDQLIGILANEIEHVRREKARAAERSDIAPILEAIRARTESNGIPTLNIDKSVLRSSVRMGDGTKISFGGMTIEDHERRIVMLESMRKGLKETIDGHRKAITILKACNAERLSDLLPAAKAS